MKNKAKRIIAVILAAFLCLEIYPLPLSDVMAQGTVGTASESDATSETDESQVPGSEGMITGKVQQKLEAGETPEAILPESAGISDDKMSAGQVTDATDSDADIAFEAETECDGVKIKVSADAGVFPEGATMKAVKISDEKAQAEGIPDAVGELIDEKTNIAKTFTFDITIYDKNGNEIEPNNDKGEVRVSFTNSLIADGNLETNVYHIKEENSNKIAEKLDADESGEAVEVTTDGFSYYTVEFTYDGLQYVMEGDTAVPLSDILNTVGLSGTIEDAYGSNDELFVAMKAVKDGRSWTESSEGEWMVVAKKAFSSNETLTVKINGIEYEIAVTDATIDSGNGIIYDDDFTKSASTLINTILGAGLSATNCAKTGTVYTFSDGNGIGLPSGIVLDTSGKVAGSNDNDLAGILDYSYGGHTSSLEFTLTATGTLLNFNYVFASKEFDQPAKYNDAFALLVSVNGGAYENIAKIEKTNGTTVPVNIQNLIKGVSGNESGHSGGTLYSAKGVTINGETTNGVSIVFNAQKKVNKGDTVKIKFAICDVSDTAYNSYVFIQASSLKFDTPGAKPNYYSEDLWDLKPGKTYKIEVGGQEYTVTADSEGKVPLEGTDKNGQNYSFIGKTISVTELDDSGEVASETQELGIANRPPAPDDPNNPGINAAAKPSEVSDEIVVSDTSITIHGSNENEYKLDEGEWQKPTNQTLVFDNLTPNHEYTIYTRVAASDEAPHGVSSEGEHIRTNEVDLALNIKNYHGTYDGEEHGADVTTATTGATIWWSDGWETNYAPTKPVYKNAGTYTVYYRVIRDGCYPAYGTLSVKIDRVNVTVQADDKSKVRTEADPQLTATVTGVIDGESEELITYTLSRAAGENAGTYTITPSGAATQGNYNVTYKTGTFTIAANPNSGSVSMADWVYGKTASNPQVTAAFGAETATFEYFVDATCTTKTSSTNGAGSEGGKPSNAGTYYVKATIPGTTNYMGVVTAADEFTISKAPITITAENKTSVYGEQIVPFTNVVSGDYKSGDNLGIELSSDVTNTSPVGDYTISVAWNNNPNYSATLVPGTYTVTKRPITIRPKAAEKTYGDEDPAFGFKITSGTLISVDSAVSVFGNGTCYENQTSTFYGPLQREPGENVGTYTIDEGSLNYSDNYEVTWDNPENSIKLTIIRKPINVKADDKQKIYGDDDPELTFTVDTNTPLVGNDTLSGSLIRTAVESVGEYADYIHQGSVTNDENSNYDITFTEGKFTITKRPVTIVPYHQEKTYGEDDPVFDLDAFEVSEDTPLVKRDDLSVPINDEKDDAVFTGLLTREKADEDVQDVGEYKILKGTLESHNYEITLSDEALVINKKKVTLIAEDKTKVYGEDDPELTFVLADGSEMAYGEDEHEIATGELAREGAVPEIESEDTAGGDDSGVPTSGDDTDTSGGSDTTDPTSGDDTDTSGGSDTTDPTSGDDTDTSGGSGTTDPTSGDDTDTSGGSDTTDPSEGEGSEPEDNTIQDVGNYAIIQHTLSLGDNYEVTFVEGNLEITKKPITITMDNKTKVYGDPDPEFTFTLDEETPLAYDEELLEIMEGEGAREEGKNVGEYTINEGTLDSPNYEISWEPGALEITKRPITIIAEDKEKDYGLEDPELTYINDESTPLYEDDDLLKAIKVNLVREKGEKFGKYAIKEDGIESENYDVTFKEGTFTINKIESGAEADVTSDDESAENLKMTTSNEDLLKMLLSEEDLQLIKDGAGVKVYFVITHLDQLKTDEETLIKNALPDGYVIGDNYDISLFKKYSFKSKPDQLHETPQNVDFELDVKLPDIPTGATREYMLIRVHNGVAEAIPATYDANTNTVSFATDRFSTYTLVYKDSLESKDGTNTKVRTGDMINMSLILTLITLSILGITLTVYKKKKYLMI